MSHNNALKQMMKELNDCDDAVAQEKMRDFNELMHRYCALFGLPVDDANEYRALQEKHLHARYLKKYGREFLVNKEVPWPIYRNRTGCFVQVQDHGSYVVSVKKVFKQHECTAGCTACDETNFCEACTHAYLNLNWITDINTDNFEKISDDANRTATSSKRQLCSILFKLCNYEGLDNSNIVAITKSLPQSMAIEIPNAAEQAAAKARVVEKLGKEFMLATLNRMKAACTPDPAKWVPLRGTTEFAALCKLGQDVMAGLFFWGLPGNGFMPQRNDPARYRFAPPGTLMTRDDHHFIDIEEKKLYLNGLNKKRGLNTDTPLSLVIELPDNVLQLLRRWKPIAERAQPDNREPYMLFTYERVPDAQKWKRLSSNALSNRMKRCGLGGCNCARHVAKQGADGAPVQPLSAQAIENANTMGHSALTHGGY